MMLNRVDLPQPEGPITPTNSPGATESETPSTAVTTPSGVSNRLVMLSTTRMPSGAAAGLDAADNTVAAAMSCCPVVPLTAGLARPHSTWGVLGAARPLGETPLPPFEPQASSAWNGRPARRHQFSQARFSV